MSKEQEPLSDDEIEVFALRAGINDDNRRGIVYGMHQARAAMKSARSKDADLIKDMLPYMQHKVMCPQFGNILQIQCSCGVSEVLQRINERSK